MNVDITAFRGLFDGSVRALLAWDRLEEARVVVGETVLDSRDALGDLLTVWYVRPDGTPGDWREPEAMAQTVAEASVSPRSWPDDRAAHLDRLSEGFSQQTEPVVLLLPAYRIGLRHLLLDASHRAVAVHRANVPLRALVLSVHGPVTGEVLPDLTRHEVAVRVVP